MPYLFIGFFRGMSLTLYLYYISIELVAIHYDCYKRLINILLLLLIMNNIFVLMLLDSAKM